MINGMASPKYLRIRTSSIVQPSASPAVIPVVSPTPEVLDEPLLAVQLLGL